MYHLMPSSDQHVYTKIAHNFNDVAFDTVSSSIVSSPSHPPGELMLYICYRQWGLIQNRVDTLVGAQTEFEIANYTISFFFILYILLCIHCTALGH